MRVAFRLMFLILLATLLSSANVILSSLHSGYAVTTDYHGLDVPLGTLVTATAATIDSNVSNVTFVWKFPNGTIAFEHVDVAVWSNGTRFPDENGTLVYYAQGSFVLTVEGEWCVQAFFKGSGGHLRGNGTDIVAIRATSPDIIPDISFGTFAGVFAAISLILSLYLAKRRRN